MSESAIARRRLRRAGINVTRLGLGTAPLGNLLAAVDDESARNTVVRAWRGGVRYFDTAPHYGLGLAERRLGAGLAQVAAARDDFVVSTKVGRTLELASEAGDTASDYDDEGYLVPRTHRRRWDFSAAGIERSLAESCERIGIDRVDIALLHDPDDHMADAIGQGYPALAALRSAGKVAAIGAGMNSAPALTRLVAECDLDVVLLAGRYSLLDQSALDDLLPVALQRGTSVVVGGAFNSGLLAQQSPDQSGTYDYAAAPPAMVEKARRLASVCEQYGVCLPHAAVQMPLGHPAVAAVAIGARTPAEVASDIDWATTPVPAAMWLQMKALGLLRRDVPLPR